MHQLEIKKKLKCINGSARRLTDQKKILFIRPRFLNQIKKLTQASVIVVVLSSTIAVPVFADRLHVPKLARAVVA